MITVNSLSGGKTSSYMAVMYKADYNVFSLVTTDDKSCLFPDKKIRQIVSDRIGKEFIGTLEEDMIVYTMLDLEQHIGQKIQWVAGKTFDEIIDRGDGKKYLPNPTCRFCTTELKLRPLFNWWYENIGTPVEMRIGYRESETRRVLKMKSQLNAEGLLEFDAIVGKTKTGKNKHAQIGWQKPVFPLIEDNVFKDTIHNYWEGKKVRFAYMNNCIGCFNRNPMLLKLMSEKFPNKFDWFVNQEQNEYKVITFKNGITYKEIKRHFLQQQLEFSDFSECDSGYCGI